MKNILFAALCCCIAFSQAQIITTATGNGTLAYGGDNGPAILAQVNQPFGIALDRAGNVYIADKDNNRIRKIDASTGIITTIAGTGTAGYAGDGALATLAQLHAPADVKVDTLGNLYIADFLNNAVRKIDAVTGNISTIAGTGNSSFSGDNGPATLAELSLPAGVFVDDSTNVYIADTYNNRIRKISSLTGIITTVAGNGTQTFSGDGGPATAAGFYYPFGVALDKTGNIYIPATDNSQIRKVDAATGIISTIANQPHYSMGYSGDNIPAVGARINQPYGITVDKYNNVYFADFGNHRIRKIDGTTGIITTVAGNGVQGFMGDGNSPLLARLHNPTGVALDAAGNMYIADFNNNRIRRVTSSTNYISGTVYNDLNGNCIRETGEQGIPNRVLKLNSNVFALTNSAGFYYFNTDTGNFSVHLQSHPYYSPLCPVSDYTMSLPTSYDSSFANDYAEQVLQFCPDLSISVATFPSRPCERNTFAISYCNNGTAPQSNVVVHFNMTNPDMIFLGSSATYTLAGPGSYDFSVGTLQPYQCGTIYITDSISCNAVIGSLTCTNAQILPYGGDCDPYNNATDDCHQVVSSHDPNAKQVASRNFLSKGFIQDGEMISPSDTLTYIIYFQNTGTDTAFHVVVRDTLSMNLDPGSVENLAASHPGIFNLYGGGILEWDMQNIILPDSTTNLTASNGFVSYRIRQKSGNTNNTLIPNQAGIFFDYNPPVLTNVCTDTVFNFTTVTIPASQTKLCMVFPNPTHDHVNFKAASALGTIQIYSAIGQVVFQAKTTENTLNVDLGYLPAGIYIAQVQGRYIRILKE